ncbi:MAG: TonB-dependent receptor, partial [Candidatus Competibacteraceae bacterium]|nr:TonB-dependent receptor [Candidatus Competibacteraceae bacterium]
MRERDEALTIEQKALALNLDEYKYGTVVEIGAGQEVARKFFRASAAAGTIAKTMSAYDMKVSDSIY